MRCGKNVSSSSSEILTFFLTEISYFVSIYNNKQTNKDKKKGIKQDIR